MKHQIKGPFLTNSNACAAGTSALIDAFKALKLDEADAFLVVSGEECDSPLNLNGCYRFQAMNKGQTEYQCLPFDFKRNGIQLGEGSAVIKLRAEREVSAPRSSDIEFEMLGYGSTSDGYHVVQTEPEGEGAFRAMKKACEGFEEDIKKEGYLVVNCHAAGTQVGDKSELKALLKLSKYLKVK
jgi:3-oxoacyl-[acyl-carrier-protein] synthase II